MHLEDLQDHTPDVEALDEGHKFGRRTFMMGALATGAAVTGPVNYAAWARGRRVPLAKDGKFPLGVAAGFPRPKGITLWTQLDGIKRSSKLRLIVSTDRHFRKIVQEKMVTARKDRGYTARTFVKGLKPHEQYFYRFATEDSHTEIGRFRTAPPKNSAQKIRIAYYSCQNYNAGYFTAQRNIANEDDIDLVVCLGDYIYEYGDTDGVPGRLDTTGDNHDGDTQFLREYRQKYHLYKRDPNLRAMHAAHPFISVWDDHEVEDNHADGNPSSAQSDPNKTNLKNLPRRVSYLQRRANGHRAFFNYNPRMRFKGDRDRIYESYRLGSLVDIVLTDERQYRDQQPCNDAILEPCADTENPNRTMLGEKQRNWFLRTLEGSQAKWKLWGTETMVMGLRVLPTVAAQVDAWDGYGFERKRMLDYIIDKNIQDVVAFTGDIHTFFAGTAYTTGDEINGRAAMPEFVGGSATSTGIPEATGLGDNTLTALAASNPHIDYYDFRKRGYAVIEASSTGLTCDLKSVNAKTQKSIASTIAKFQVTPGKRIPDRIA